MHKMHVRKDNMQKSLIDVMWICTRGQERWNSSPNMIEMKLVKDGSTKLAMPILLRMLTSNGRQVPNEDLCCFLSICILEYMARTLLFNFK